MIAPKVHNFDVTKQAELDHFLIKLDGAHSLTDDGRSA